MVAASARTRSAAPLSLWSAASPSATRRHCSTIAPSPSAPNASAASCRRLRSAFDPSSDVSLPAELVLVLDLEPACFPALREDAETPVGAGVARLRCERARELEALLDDGGVAELGERFGGPEHPV